MSKYMLLHSICVRLEHVAELCMYFEFKATQLLNICVIQSQFVIARRYVERCLGRICQKSQHSS
jgi:hypothetical protein